MTRALAALVLVASIGGCGSKPTTLTAMLTATPDCLTADRIHVSLLEIGADGSMLVYDPIQTNPIEFPTSLVVILPSSFGGPLTVDVDAKRINQCSYTEEGAPIAHGQQQVDIVPHEDNQVTVSLSGTETGCTPALACDGGAPDSPDDGGDAGAGVDAGSGDADAGCRQTTCGTACVDIMSSDANCGACGYACIDGRTCSQGRCTPAWKPVATAGAPTARIRHAASALGGRVYLSGGTQMNGMGSLGDTYRYDPGTDTWAGGPALSQSRCAHVSSAFGGTVYVFGGLSDCSNGAATGPALEAYDTTKNAWAPLNVQGQPTLRYNAQAVPLPAGGFLVFGGAGGGFSMTPSGARFDGAWTDASCPLADCASSSWAGLFVLNGTSVVAWGGAAGMPGISYDLAGGAWSVWTVPVGSPAKPSQFAQSASRWFVLRSSDGTDCPPSVSVAIFDEANGTWTSDTATAPMGLAVPSNTTNETVWTGTEIFSWSAACSGAGVGGRYQPPAP